MRHKPSVDLLAFICSDRRTSRLGVTSLPLWSSIRMPLTSRQA